MLLSNRVNHHRQICLRGVIDYMNRHTSKNDTSRAMQSPSREREKVFSMSKIVDQSEKERSNVGVISFHKRSVFFFTAYVPYNSRMTRWMTS